MEEKVFIPNKKGLKLAAVIHRPEGEGKFPGVMVLHGFSGDKEELHIKELAIDLEKAGFVAIRFESSGSGESEGSLEHDFRLTNYFNDVDSVFDYFSKLSFVDNARIGIVGHSLGAHVGLLYVAKNPTIKAICAISPFILFSNINLGISMNDWKQTGWYEKVRSSGAIHKFPWAFVEEADKSNVMDILHTITAKKLIIVGTKDEVVNPLETKKIFEVASQPKELLELPGIGHAYKKFPDQVAMVNEKVVAFFAESL